MIVAGVGCKKDVSATPIVALVRAAMERHGHSIAELGLLATGEIKRSEPGIVEAAGLLGVPLLIVDDNRLQAAASRCLTSSKTSQIATGLPSLSEACAIVAAGPGGRLLGPRLTGYGVTCAIGATAWSAKGAQPQ